MQVGGYFKQVGNLVFCVVLHSGHLIPSTQLAMSRWLVKDMHEFKKLKCHLPNEDDCKITTKMCQYMNQCNQHGTCSADTGKCTCTGDWMGADCSIMPEDFTKLTQGISIQPQSWAHFINSNTTQSTIQLSGDNLQVYTSATTLPSISFYDRKISGNNPWITLTPKDKYISIYNA